MEGARAHPLRIILFSSVFFFLGFFLGFYAIYLPMPRGRAKNQAASGNINAGSGGTIMAKRMQAIKSARQKGRDAYEFEVSGFYPTLSK